QLAGGVGIALGHGDGIVLVPRADELDAEPVERDREDRRVVAHEPEHGADAEGLDVLGQDLEHRRDPTVVHLALPATASPRSGPGRRAAQPSSAATASISMSA